MAKVKAAIIGTGNIGTDLLVKLNRSELIECSLFAGRNPDSAGIKRASEMGVPVSLDSVHAIERNPGCCDIVFDATSAMVHAVNAPILKKLKKFTIDLTPSRIGKMCIPSINLDDAINEDNVNTVTCGGQSTVPIAYAIKQVHPELKYIEIVSSISSRSAGPGTRANIDEYTQATKEALRQFTGIPEAKAIIILNPAEPPIIMRNTIYAMLEKPDMTGIIEKVNQYADKIRKYVPGYKIIVGPVFENNRVTTTIEVTGLGDFLPPYAGNLDIINCAAINIAEEYARKKLLNGGMR
ncbi:MAG TPA: acetaldehyde dehydrogenase (acetylating) [Candidatus Goldiibacteriota bacterium]|nr:acetaldehyde dehydrogenase (acetylating) [Candidatus Goldiibacteriota bacterium]HRQ44154.1 acetaldehyde dehydrogenase (acetylating) [Candidatus Goldiibacteriota bacterium]